MRNFVSLLLVIALLGFPAHAEKIVVPAKVSVESLPEGTATRPVQLSKIIVKLSRGEPIGRVKGGLICVVAEPLIWKGGRMQLDVTDFDEVFKDELSNLGFDVVSVVGEMFDQGDDKRAEYLIGGTVKSMLVDVCYPNSGFGDFMSAKGTALMEVEWQIFNRLDRTVVATYKTRTGFEQKKSQAGGFETIIFSAFAENIRALAASGLLKKHLVGTATNLTVARVPDAGLSKLPLVLVRDRIMPLTDVVGATVLIQSGDGHGSGFLISSDGHLMTNYHVIGAAKFVKVRWSDGAETLGEVVRSDRGRDIALIKTDGRGRSPLSFRTGNISVGETVVAVGAPLDKKLQNTVTQGIHSSSRVLDGYNYLQSDVSVVPGNSGGPLVDKDGRLVGITVSGLRINEAPQGVNFFIPATEALSFLAIE